MSFKEGKLPLVSITPKFNAQGFYSHITGFAKTDSVNHLSPYTRGNKYLINKGVIGHETIIADDAETPTDLENAVKAHAGCVFVDCVSYTLDCEGHLNDNNKT